MPARKPLEQKRRTARSATKDSAGRPLPHPDNVVALRGIEGGAATPDLPATILPDGPGADRWRRIWSEATWLSPKTDLDVARRLCELDDLLLGVKGALADSDALVEGSTGQLKANPLFAVQRATAAEILTLERQLGLTPAARGALGVGEVKASAGESTLESIILQAANRGPQKRAS